ncbi:MAG: L,D-transpeptidase [Candidatus Dormibacteraeota bacterium]|nr:L,D-transpeptidase [Candidatus Dormibacteraeota bacterium]
MSRGVRVLLAAACLSLLAPLALPRTVAAGETGGVVRDGWGGLHPFGGFQLNTDNAPYWPGWDIARSLVVRADGGGGWVLDGWGGVHNFGDAVAVSDPAYWQGWDIARSLVLTSFDASGEPDGRQGYVLDGFGGVHPFGGAPQLSGSPYTQGRDLARGLAISFDGSGVPDGGWVLQADGTVHAFGAASALSLPSARGGDAWHAIHITGATGYAVGRYGAVAPLSGAATSSSWAGYPDWGSWDITRDVAIPATVAGSSSPSLSFSATRAFQAANAGWSGGAILDAYGGLHAFGGLQLNTAGLAYWPKWDIARCLVIRDDGSGGWVLDGFGGIHPFGSASAVNGTPYWPRWDIARSLVLTGHDGSLLPDGSSGYILDGWGGIHAFGGAPQFDSPHYTAGADTASGLEIHYDAAGTPDGGWLADSNGSVYAFGVAPPSPSAATAGPVLEQFHAVGEGMLAVDHWGVTRSLGTTGVDWSGYVDWGAQDLTRDIAAVGGAGPSEAQPVSATARAEHDNEAAGGAPDPELTPSCGAPMGTAGAGKWIIASTRCEETAAYYNGVLQFATYVTTAGPCCHTPTGQFTIQWKRSPWAIVSQPGLFTIPYTPINYAMQFYQGGFLFHDAPWRTLFGPGSNYVVQLFEGSHGCIETPESQMARLYAFADVGTPVEIF